MGQFFKNHADQISVGNIFPCCTHMLVDKHIHTEADKSTTGPSWYSTRMRQCQRPINVQREGVSQARDDYYKTILSLVTTYLTLQGRDGGSTWRRVSSGMLSS